MKPSLPKAFDSRGSSMGRRDSIMEPDAAIKFHLVQLRIDKGGYDSGGAYWGKWQSHPMWAAWGDGPLWKNEMWIRARSREEAKAQVRDSFKHATFYR